MTEPVFWLAATVTLPALMAIACLSHQLRARILAWLPAASIPGFIAAVFARGHELAISPDRLGFTLSLDDTGAIFLAGASLLWLAAAVYAGAHFKKESGAVRFLIWWLLTLCGSLGTFIAADIVTFYLFFSLASLAAYGLVTYSNTAKARRAGVVYMVLALAGEAFVLLALVMVASLTPLGNPLIRDAVLLVPGATLEAPIIALVILGFGLKMGLVPLHVWMPLAHPVAPVAASAVLSGILVKAGVIGLIRFLPLQSAIPDWGAALLSIGLLTAFYGVVIGLTQQKLKTILAYSTISQMGVIAAILGCGLETTTTNISHLAAFYSLHHMLVKGALFVGLGIFTALSAEQRHYMFWPMMILALSLAGLPLTSGAAAKFATKDVFETAGAAWLATLSTIGSGVLMTHFLILLHREVPAVAPTGPPTRVISAWAIVAVTTLIIPLGLLPAISKYTFADLLSWNSLIAAAWPVAAGATLAINLRKLRLPKIPEGDIITLYEKLAPAFARMGRLFEWGDEHLKDWSVACLVMFAIAMAFGSTILWAH